MRGVLHSLAQRMLHSYLLITSRQEALVVTSGGAFEPASRGGFLSSVMCLGLSRPGLSASVNMACVAVSARGVVEGGALFADHFALTVVTSHGLLCELARNPLRLSVVAFSNVIPTGFARPRYR